MWYQKDKQRMVGINKGAMLVAIIILTLVVTLGSSWLLLAGPRNEEQPMSVIPSSISSPTAGITTNQQVIPSQPEKGGTPSRHRLTREELERLRRKTEIVDPKYMDNNPSSPPGLPLTPGPETVVHPGTTTPIQPTP
jgi:hypothetical protein